MDPLIKPQRWSRSSVSGPTLRPRFSLRTFLIAVALIAALCYCWFVLPYVLAKRFIAAINAHDYEAADALFTDTDERFIVASANKFWAFRPSAKLAPATLTDLLSGRRQVTLYCSYFYLDEHVSGASQFDASPLGLKLRNTSESRSALIIDRAHFAVPKMPQR